jgi:hypothetical protein
VAFCDPWFREVPGSCVQAYDHYFGCLHIAKVVSLSLNRRRPDANRQG